jgi:alkylated DNA repair dioxygenase AlkB
VLLGLLLEYGLDGEPTITTYDNAATVYESWYTPEETQALFTACAKLNFNLRTNHWGQTIRHQTVGFTAVPSARLEMIDAEHPLSEAPSEIAKLLADLSRHSGKDVNYASVVRYRDGEDYINWHQHKEDKGRDATVWIVSTGAERPFAIKRVGGKPIKFTATQGSLIILSSEANDTHLHSVPKCKGCTGVRYSVNCKAIPIKADGKPKRWYKVGADSRTLSIGTKHDKQQAGPVAKAGRATVKVSGDMTDLAKSVAKDGKVVAVTPGSGGIKWKDSGVGDPTGCLTFSTPTLPPTPASLESVLEKDVPEKYNITAKCAAGILRRAASGSRAGKLPPYLEKALKSVAAERDETVIHSSDCDDCHEGEVASHPEPTLEDAVNEAKPSAEK